MHASGGLRPRRVLIWAALGIALLFLVWQLARLAQPGVLDVDDFVQYWAAVELHLAGGNPYAPDQMLAMERLVGWDEEHVLLFWATPIALVLLLPFAWLPYSGGRLLWLAVNLASLVVSVTWLWSYYAGPRSRRWMALLALVTFPPALFVLTVGQITPLVLLGIVGFLYFENQKRGWLAGSCAALTLIKPQLVYLFWIALLLWVARRRAWSFLLGAIIAAGIALVPVWMLNSQVLAQYAYALLTYPPRQYATPTIGSVLRLISGVDRLWLQFVPPFLASLWFVWYWRRYKEGWTWSEQMPVVLLISIATAAYSWGYDLVLALPAVIQVATWLASRPGGWRSTLVVVTYLMFAGLANPINLLRTNAIWYTWMAPALLVWYLMSKHLLAEVPDGGKRVSV